jgi:hypothetical protein
MAAQVAASQEGLSSVRKQVLSIWGALCDERSGLSFATSRLFFLNTVHRHSEFSIVVCFNVD